MSEKAITPVMGMTIINFLSEVVDDPFVSLRLLLLHHLTSQVSSAQIIISTQEKNKK